MAPAERVARSALHSWPGNVRQLRNVARHLGISRPSIYHLMNKSPRLRTGADISLEDLKASWERNSGDVAAMAAELAVPEQGLQRRLSKLGQP